MTTSASNLYQKFQEVIKVFLNPDLELIRNGQSLEDHCYFIIHKYPKADNPIWEAIDQAVNVKDARLEYLNTITIDDANLKHNLDLAYKKNDLNYLEYLLGFRPKSNTKKTLTFHKKKDLISKELSIQLTSNTDNPIIDRIVLKQLIHQYIQKHQLQDGNEFYLDPLLREILNINDQEKIHYFDFLQVYKDKYYQKTELKL